MNTGDEMVQTMKILYQGVEYTLRLSGALVKNAALLIAALLHKQSEKPSVGKTNLINMLKDGDAIKVLQFNDSDLSNFCRLAKDYGFPVVPVKNRAGNELGNVLVREKDAEQINAALNALGFAKMQMQEQEKNARGTPPPSYSNGRESSLGRRRSETPRIGEGAGSVPLLQTGDAQHGDFVPAYCYSPDVVYTEPPRPIPLLGDGQAHSTPPDIVHAEPPFIPLLVDNNRVYRDRHRKTKMRMDGRYSAPNEHRPSPSEQRQVDIILSPAEYTVSDPVLSKRQETEPLVFLQDPQTGSYEMLAPGKSTRQRPAPNRERKPSVKAELAKHSAKLKAQAKKEPVKQRAAER